MTTPVSSTTPLWGAAAPTTPVAAPTSDGNALGKDAFLKLLVAQMKNQDPDKPMDASEMSAQLAQFSSVEQLTQINQTLTSQGTTQSSMISTMNAGISMSALGKQVTAASDAVTVGAGGSATAMDVVVASGGGAATLHVLDANGAEVATKNLGTLDGGKHAIDTASATKGLAAGTYHLTVGVTSPTGSPVDAQTYISGRVDRVAYTSAGPVFSIGDIPVSMSNIAQIEN